MDEARTMPFCSVAGGSHWAQSLCRQAGAPTRRPVNSCPSHKHSKSHERSTHPISRPNPPWTPTQLSQSHWWGSRFSHPLAVRPIGLLSLSAPFRSALTPRSSPSSPSRWTPLPRMGSCCSREGRSVKQPVGAPNCRGEQDKTESQNLQPVQPPQPPLLQGHYWRDGLALSVTKSPLIHISSS